MLKRTEKQTLEDQQLFISADEAFSHLDKRYGKVDSLIKGYRLKHKMSQKQLAEKIGIEQGDLSKIENGKRSVGKDIAQRLAKIFNVDYRSFL